MFAALRSFLSRHRRKFIVSGVVIGGGYLLSRYVRHLLREWHESETRQIFEMSRKKRHYEGTERTCNQTALTLSQKMKETVDMIVKTDELIEELKNEVSDAGKKVRIWEKLKAMVFTKLILLIYLSSFLMVALRLQFNLIGGYMFKDISEDNILTSKMQEKYLGMCQYLLKEGASRLYTIIHEKVTYIMTKRNLTDKLTINDIELILQAMQNAIKGDLGDPCLQLPSYIVAPDGAFEDLNENESKVYRKILTETVDLLESDEIVSLSNSCINRGLSFATDCIAEHFDTFLKKGASNGSTYNSLNNQTLPLARVIPIVNCYIQSQFKQSDNSKLWIQQLVLMNELKVMGANIYETFSS